MVEQCGVPPTVGAKVQPWKQQWRTEISNNLLETPPSAGHAKAMSKRLMVFSADVEGEALIVRRSDGGDFWDLDLPGRAGATEEGEGKRRSRGRGGL